MSTTHYSPLPEYASVDDRTDFKPRHSHGKTSEFVLPSNASGSLGVAINPDNAGNQTYQATQPAQEKIAKKTWLSCNSVPLTCECPQCDGEGRVYKSRYGGNDPDTWTIRCDTCAGDGEIVRLCEAQRCDRHATELVTFADCTEPYCEHCAPEMRIEAVTERLAGLT